MIPAVNATMILTRLIPAAHSGRIIDAQDCAACKQMAHQLAAWLAAHGEPPAEARP